MNNPYGKYLGERNPFEVIAGTTGRLEELYKKIGKERAGVAPAPGKWSVREILCHLADCEIAFGFRFRQTVAETDHVIQPFDQEKWAATYAAYGADEALATFAALRLWNLLLLRSLTAETYGKAVSHPERGAGTLQLVMETMAGHDLNHLGQIEALAG